MWRQGAGNVLSFVTMLNSKRGRATEAPVKVASLPNTEISCSLDRAAVARREKLAASRAVESFMVGGLRRRKREDKSRSCSTAAKVDRLE